MSRQPAGDPHSAGHAVRALLGEGALMVRFRSQRRIESAAACIHVAAAGRRH
jgi:hypothetical protein